MDDEEATNRAYELTAKLFDQYPRLQYMDSEIIRVELHLMCVGCYERPTAINLAKMSIATGVDGHRLVEILHFLRGMGWLQGTHNDDTSIIFTWIGPHPWM